MLLATGAADGGVGVWAIKGKDCIGRAFVTPHSAAVTSLSFTRDSRFLLSAGLDGAVHIMYALCVYALCELCECTRCVLCVYALCVLCVYALCALCVYALCVLCVSL